MAYKRKISNPERNSTNPADKQKYKMVRYSINKKSKLE